MDHRSSCQLLAQYNQWMNRNLYTCAAQLSRAALMQERGAFFGSIFGTLNHLAVADTLWLKRFASHPVGAVALQPLLDAPMPQRLDQPLFDELDGLARYREWLDGLTLEFIGKLDEGAFGQSLGYNSIRGIPATHSLHALLLHFFNHQTHHRGQVTTLLMQAGIDPGVTDLLALIAQRDPA